MPTWLEESSLFLSVQAYVKSLPPLSTRPFFVLFLLFSLLWRNLGEEKLPGREKKQNRSFAPAGVGGLNHSVER